MPKIYKKKIKTSNKIVIKLVNQILYINIKYIEVIYYSCKYNKSLKV